MLQGVFSSQLENTVLTGIRIRNFGSVRDLTLDLRYPGKRAPAGFASVPRMPFIEKAGLRIVPVLALFGANGSGKSTILRAVAWLAKFGGGQLPASALWHPNALTEPLAPVTEIEMSLADEGGFFTYSVKVSQDAVLEETLLLNGSVLFHSHDGELSVVGRDGADIVKQGLQKACFDDKGRQVRALLPAAAETFPGLDAAINRAFEIMANDVLIIGDDPIDPCQAVEMLAATFGPRDRKTGEEAALALLAQYLRKLDFGIARIDMRCRDAAVLRRPFGRTAENVKRTDFFLVHQTADGRGISMKLEDESSGTRRLFGLLAVLLTAVRCGGVVLADRFETSLHSELLPELLKLFSLLEINTAGAQIIFATHGTSLLDAGQLQAGEIAFLTQYGTAGTVVRRLSDFPEAVKAGSVRERYLRGDFDALPSAFV